jgi:hypothetical protein
VHAGTARGRASHRQTLDQLRAELRPSTRRLVAIAPPRGLLESRDEIAERKSGHSEPFRVGLDHDLFDGTSQPGDLGNSVDALESGSQELVLPASKLEGIMAMRGVRERVLKHPAGARRLGPDPHCHPWGQTSAHPVDAGEYVGPPGG